MHIFHMLTEKKADIILHVQYDPTLKNSTYMHFKDWRKIQQNINS